MVAWLWNVIMWSLYPHLSSSCHEYIRVTSLVSKWQTEISSLGYRQLYVFHVPFSVSSEPSEWFWGNWGNSFEGFLRYSAYKNEAPKWKDNPDTKSMKTKTLIGFSKSYYANYILGCECHKQNSIHHHCMWGQVTSSLATDTHCTPAHICTTITVAFPYNQN